MNAATITQELRDFIAENYLLGQECTFEDDDSFLDHGIIDSTGVLQLVGFLEETYGIIVDDQELTPQNLDSITAVSAYLRRKLNGAAKVDGPAAQESILGGNA